MDNPFINELYDLKTSKKDVTVADGGMMEVTDTKTGQVVTAAMRFIQEKRMDNSYFVKEFPAGMFVLSELSACARLVVVYIKLALVFQSDVFVFDTKKCMEVTGITDKFRIYRAIRELKDKEVIAGTGKPKTYFINPLMFFRGDRIKLLNKYRFNHKNKKK